jgi:DNA invertase Pin-like site-specific DNA recombinase
MALSSAPLLDVRATHPEEDPTSWEVLRRCNGEGHAGAGSGLSKARKCRTNHDNTQKAVNHLSACFVRVSTKKQGERGASVETQRADCLAHAERQGWTVVLLEEDHESGTTFERRGYQSLLSAAKEGRIEGVVVRDLSRFGRGDLGATAREFEDFRKAGCFIASALDGVILQPTEHLAKRLDVGIKVLVNGYYSAMLAEHVPPNMERRVREGKWVSSAPFGYRVVEAPPRRSGSNAGT